MPLPPMPLKKTGELIIAAPYWQQPRLASGAPIFTNLRTDVHAPIVATSVEQLDGKRSFSPTAAPYAPARIV
jgi:hypothetical protein